MGRKEIAEKKKIHTEEQIIQKVPWEDDMEALRVWWSFLDCGQFKEALICGSPQQKNNKGSNGI